jgi:hypothetical protein
MIPRGVLLSASPAIGGGGITVGLVIGLQLVIVALVLGVFAWYVRGRRPGLVERCPIGADPERPGRDRPPPRGDPRSGRDGRHAAGQPAWPRRSRRSIGGAVLYQANCARCHGVDGLGGGIDSTRRSSRHRTCGAATSTSTPMLTSTPGSRRACRVGCRPGPVSCRRPTDGTSSTTSDRSTDTGHRPIRARRRVHRSWPGSASRACSPPRCSAGSGSACAAVDRDSGGPEGPG